MKYDKNYSPLIYRDILEIFDTYNYIVRMLDSVVRVTRMNFSGFFFSFFFFLWNTRSEKSQMRSRVRFFLSPPGLGPGHPSRREAKSEKGGTIPLEVEKGGSGIFASTPARNSSDKLDRNSSEWNILSIRPGDLSVAWHAIRHFIARLYQSVPWDPSSHGFSCFGKKKDEVEARFFLSFAPRSPRSLPIRPTNPSCHVFTRVTRVCSFDFIRVIV